jgi:hypothetical protein
LNPSVLTSATAVIERRTVITRDHATHPYEAGWAAEAVFFVHLEGRHPRLAVQAQISPDGISWVDRGQPLVMEPETELAELDLVHFGGWLRLLLRGADDANPATLLIHLALKG